MYKKMSADIGWGACLHNAHLKPFLTLRFTFTCAGRFVLAAISGSQTNMKRKKMKRQIHPELGLSAIRLNMSQRSDLETTFK